MTKNYFSGAREAYNSIMEDKQQKSGPEFKWITEWSQQFYDQIEKPIGLRQSCLKKAEPQRCLQHSIIFSLYCTICRKILCASCMYNTMIHRKHRVIPLQNAIEQIKQDIKTFESKISRVSMQTAGLININSELLMKLDREYSPLQVRIQKFYEELRQVLKRKEHEQMIMLKEMKQSAHSEILAYNRELTRLSTFVSQKYGYYTDENVKSRILLGCRNVMEILLSTSNLINENLLESEKYSFPTNQQKIRKIQEEIQLKVEGLLIFKQFKLNGDKVKTKGYHKPPEKVVSFRDLSSNKDDKYRILREPRRQNSSVIELRRTSKKQ